MSGELSEAQKEKVLYVARAGVIDLISEHPELGIRFGADDLTTVYLAGVRAGAEAAGEVLEAVAANLDAEL